MDGTLWGLPRYDSIDVIDGPKPQADLTVGDELHNF